MAYIECKLRSEILQTKVDIALYFPTDLPDDVGNEVRGVLTLLHGYTGCGADWMQMTSAARYAADNGFVLIMPSCTNSFYQDMMYGGAWKTFLTEEMPAQLHTMFQLPSQREKNFIAGLSMGGYGALYLGLSRPDLYAGCASFSGAVDVQSMIAYGEEMSVRTVFTSIFGMELTVPDSSKLDVLAQRISALPTEEQPRILLTNGLQDIPGYSIKPQNDALHATLKDLPLAKYRRMEWDGVHEWNFWDRSLVYALDYFLDNGYAAKKHNDWQVVPIIE